MASNDPNLAIGVQIAIQDALRQMGAMKRGAKQMATSITDDWVKANTEMRSEWFSTMGDAQRRANDFRRALKLEQTFNPAAAASRKFAQDLQDLNEAFETGAIKSISQYQDAVARLEAQYTKTQAKLAKGLEQPELRTSARGFAFADEIKDASEAFDVFTNRINELQQRFDPVRAAARQLASEIEALNEAHRLGAVDAIQYATALRQIQERAAANTGGELITSTSGFINVDAFRDAGDAFAVFEQRFQDLRAQFDPVTAASVAYSQRLEDLNEAHRIGAVSAVQYAVALREIQESQAGQSGGVLRTDTSGFSMVDSIKDAVDSFRVFEERFTDLQARFDPVTASARVLSAQIDDLNEAHRIGAVDALRYGQALREIQQGAAGAQQLITSTSGFQFVDEFKDASTAMDAFSTRILQLAEEFDPLVARQRQYARDIDRLNEAHRLGSINAVQYAAALNKIQAESQQAAQSVQSLRTTARGFEFDEFKDAATSAQAFQNEIDDLRSKYDPLFAATQRYNREVEELNRLWRIGAVQANVYQQAMGQIQARKTASSIGLATGAVGALRRVTRSSFGDMRMMGLQLSQVAQQGAITGDYMRALAWQLPDLTLGFGTAGIAIGAIGGILATVVLDMLDAEATTEDFAEALDKVASAVGEADAALGNLAQGSVAAIVARFGENTEEIRRLLEFLARDAGAELQEAATDAARQLQGRDFQGLIPANIRNFTSAAADSTLESVEETKRQIRQLESEIQTQRGPFGDGFVDQGSLNLLADLNEELRAAEAIINNSSFEFDGIDFDLPEIQAAVAAK